MGNSGNELARHVEVLTRLGVLIGRLGIDSGAIRGRVEHLGLPRRVTLDAEAPRIALRFESPSALTARPSDQRFLELVQMPGLEHLVEIELAVGTRPFAEDAVLVGGDATEQLGAHLAAIGGGRCDALGRCGDIWMATVIVGPGSDLADGTTRLGQLAATIGVHGFQVMLLEQTHVAHAARGYAVSLACDAERVLPELVIEYRDVAWSDVVGITDALRRPVKSGALWGALAGAFDSPRAAALIIELRKAGAPNVRVSVDPTATG